MRKKIAISKADKADLRAVVERRMAYTAALADLSAMLLKADKGLWKAIWGKWPNAAEIDTPMRGRWHVTVDERG